MVLSLYESSWCSIIFCEKSRHEFKRRVKTQEFSRNVTCLLHFHCILSSSLKYNGKANTDPMGQILIQFCPLLQPRFAISICEVGLAKEVLSCAIRALSKVEVHQ